MQKHKQTGKRVRNHVTIDFDGLTDEEKEKLRSRGLIQDGIDVHHFSRRPIFMDEFQTTPNFTHQYLALEPGLNGVTYRVFHYLCYILEFGNWIDISTVWVAEKLGLKRQQVSEAMVTLEKKGLLIRGEKIGRHYKWRLNPEATWRGRATTRWESVEEIPYSDFIEKRIEYGEQNDLPLSYLRFLRPINGGRKQNATKEEIERDIAYNRAIRSRLYGEEYADGVEWKELSEAEAARLNIRAAKVQVEMKESGEWDKLKNEFYPPEDKPKAKVIDLAEQAKRRKEVQELVDELLSSGIDLKQVKELLQKSGTR